MNQSTSSTTSGSSRLSTKDIMSLIEKLKNQQNRESMKLNYVQIWRHFNKFLIQLDKIPVTWEEKVSLYCAFLIEHRRKSQTVRSYISAIKSILKTDGYKWDNDYALIGSLTRACKLQNDVVKARFPIHWKLL